MQELHISVRNLVEFILRSGDIDNRSGRMMTDAMLEGGKIHRKIQQSMGADYQAEVPLALTIDAQNYRLVVEGRADGIAYGRFPNDKTEGSGANSDIQEQMTLASCASLEQISLVVTEENLFEENHEVRDNNQDKHCIEQENMVYIDEIKGMYRNVQTMEEPVSVHLAQAKCYAYIYALQKHLDRIGVQMTYCNLDTEERKYFQEVFAWDDLAEWFGNLIAEYRKWADWQIMWREKRQASIQNLEFPYPYREGQRKLVGDVYRTIKRGKNLFIQAPTGVGKTISTIFPAVKAVGEELADRIFYLTAKTITATVAKDTFGLLREQGYQAKVIQLTAKEKLCLCGRTTRSVDINEQLSLLDLVQEPDEMQKTEQNESINELKEDAFPDFPQVKLECNPQNCPYAQGHFDRVNDAVFELLQESDLFTREEILAQAEKYRVCPFELSLDVATWCDNILCDYNYVFDPNVYLKRFFQDSPKEKFLFLVDEAHNLVDRSREMYSAALYKEDVLAVRKIMKVQNRKIARTLDKCNQAMLDLKRECETYEVCESVGVLTFHLMRLLSQMEEFFEKPREFPERKTVLDFYFALRNFLNIYDLVDENYVIYDELQEDGRFMIKLFCVDPSKNLQKCIDKSVSTIFFSATLLPINYYKRLLSTKEDNYAIYAQSTFDEEQRLLLFGRDVSTKYTRRGPEEYAKIAAYISVTIRGKQGNYMVFFPSYKMMRDVYEVFAQAEKGSDTWDSVVEGDKQRNSADGPAELNRDQKNELNQCEDYCAESQSEQETCKISNRLTIIMQQSNMNEAEREEFLHAFDEERSGTLVAFCVMGGIFGEGIDLKKDRLIGAIIVGTGLPQISNEREILKQYYDKRGLSGFDYAFRYPGINKVLQAAGRVIRTQEDHGIIVLLDERFLQSDYDALYPREWSRRVVGDVDLLKREIQTFWGKTNLSNKITGSEPMKSDPNIPESS